MTEALVSVWIFVQVSVSARGIDSLHTPEKMIGRVQWNSEVNRAPWIGSENNIEMLINA